MAINFFKSWQFNVNNRIATVVGQTSFIPETLLLIKNIFKGWANSPWTVVGSSNAVAFGMDGVDRWNATSDLVWGAGNRSWIVLRQTGITSNFQVLWDLGTSTNTDTMTAYFSPAAGFTGGALNARPTATDEVRLLVNEAWISFAASAGGTVVHAWQSTDGANCRVMISAFFDSGVHGFSGAMFFEKPLSPAANWSNPCTAWMIGTISGSNLIFTHWLNNGNFRARIDNVVGATGAANTGLYATCEGLGAASMMDDLPFQANSRALPLFPIGLARPYAPLRGRFGALPDLWYAPGCATWGTGYPADKSRRLMTLDQLVFPWNGTKLIS